MDQKEFEARLGELRSLFESPLGIGFVESIEDVMSIRRDRRANYGESYLDDEHIAMYFIMRNKLRRYVQQLDVSVGDNGDVTEVFKDIDKAYDSILDLAVFALFEMDKMRRKMPG